MIRWGRSVLDWHIHAVDESRDHPVDVWLAECGHRLTVVTTMLHDEPCGQLCQQCANCQLASPPGADYFDQLRASVARLQAARWVLTQVIALADEAPELTDEQLRNRLGALAHRARIASSDDQVRKPNTMTETVTVCLPASALYYVHRMATVDTVAWWCVLCDTHGAAQTEPLAWDRAIDHLAAVHQATINRPTVGDG